MCIILEVELEVGTSLVARDWLRVIGILARATSCISDVDNECQARQALYSRLGLGFCRISVNVAKEAFVRAATPDCVSVAWAIADNEVVVGMISCRSESIPSSFCSPSLRLDVDVETDARE